MRGTSGERTRLACWRRCLAVANFSCTIGNLEILALEKDCFGATPKPASETDALPRIKQTERFCITSYLQLRESDLLGRHGRHRIVQLSFSFLRRSFFVRHNERMRWTGQIFWLLAYDACAAPHLLPAFTPENSRGLAQWEVVSSYSSATAPDSHRISCADPLFQARKELDRRLATCAPRVKIYLINRPIQSCDLV